MNTRFLFKKRLLSALVAGICAPYAIYAEPLDLAKYPPGKISVLPAPNVILLFENKKAMDQPYDSSVGSKSRLENIKDAVVKVFSDTSVVPYGKMRMIWANTSVRANSGAVNAEIETDNWMLPWTDARHTELIKFINNLTTTNARDVSDAPFMLNKYLGYSALDDNNPFAALPGTKGKPFLGCRRSYGITLSEGSWSNFTWEPETEPNGDLGTFVNGEDGRNKKLPDGTMYDVTSPQTRVYRDESPSTVADGAFYTWSKDLQPKIPNEIVPSRNDGVPKLEKIGGVDVEKYWNPKHDPATWQHLVMYNLIFSAKKNPWTVNGVPSAPLWDTLNGDMYAGDFPNLVNGTVSWPKITDYYGSNTPNSNPLQFEQRPVDMWHAAINSRGKYYALGEGSKFSVEDAFRDVLTQINRDNYPSATSSAGGASTNIRTALNLYGAGYVPERWSGYVKSNKLDTAGMVTTNSEWGGSSDGPNTTATLLDERNVSTRLVLTTNDDIPNKGVVFEWSDATDRLSAAQKAMLNKDGKGKERVNYLRGDRTLEKTAVFRVRDSIQGDIVNSGIWYLDAPASNYAFGGYQAFSKAQRGRLPMIYVGGNDGMLHGFSAVNGEEKIAYVPKGVIAKLASLSSPSYTHQYFVDGSPFTGDLKVGTDNTAADWRTYLVGSLAGGGKGYFVLDVTQPGGKSGTPSSDFATSNAAKIAVLDRSLDASALLIAGSDDEDIGHIFASPVLDESNPFKSTQIAKLNDDRWAVVMGNGYNSKNERPVLLIQYLDSTNEINGVKELKRLVATGTQVPSTPRNAAVDVNVTANGLSAPRLVDINGDGRMDVAYAGDLKGNLWKFDLTSNTAANWGVAAWGSSSATPCLSSDAACTPLFTAAFSGKRQGITAAPTVKANDRGAGGMMVAFGTGVNLNDDDGRSKDMQSVYSVLDNTRYKLTSDGKSVQVNTASDVGALPTVVKSTDLVEQTLASSTAIAGQSKSSARQFWNVSQNGVNYSAAGAGASKKGWYFNLPEERERVLKPMSFFDASNNLMVFSTAPAYTGTPTGVESCTPSGTNEAAYLTLMNIMDGKKPSVQVMDSNGDGLYNNTSDKDAGVSRMSLPPESINIVTGKKAITLIGSDGKPDALAPMPVQPMRPSWRQLQ